MSKEGSSRDGVRAFALGNCRDGILVSGRGNIVGDKGL